MKRARASVTLAGSVKAGVFSGSANPAGRSISLRSLQETPLTELTALTAIEKRADAVHQFERLTDDLSNSGRTELNPAEKRTRKTLRRTIRKCDKEIRAARSGRSPAIVRNEPKTYGEGSRHSYYADLARSSSPQWTGHHAALERLQKHSHELTVDAATDPATREHLVRSLRTVHRDNPAEARRAVLKVESRVGMDTTAASGGSFVTPVYDVADYAAYHQFGRVFCDQVNRQPLPEYGMTVFLPALSGPAGVASQATQGTGVQETDPTAGYLSSNLVTEAGEVTISQQLLDRAGPNFHFDLMIQDQLRRAYNFTFNQAVITAALSGAGTPTIPTTPLTVAQFYSDVAAAKAAVATAAGVILPATHLFCPQASWEWLASRTDDSGHPLMVPTVNGNQAVNAQGAGPGMSVAEGDTGYKVLGLKVFEDGGIPLSSGNAQVVVAHAPEVWVWEGDLATRTIPQTFAQNLQVLLQVYAYYAVIVRYPKAVQSLTGAAFPANPTF